MTPSQGEPEPGAPMHADEIPIDVDLVRRLLATQFPRWADLPIRPVQSNGTVNALYRLGGDMVVRLPRLEEWAGAIDHEYRWLPRLAPHLPAAVPLPIAQGHAGEGYPCPWLVNRWIEEATPTVDPIIDPARLAVDVAAFIAAMQQIEAADGPPARRGAHLSTQDEFTRASIDESRDDVDVKQVSGIWEEALSTPEWDGPPVWVHGDLLPDNLLVQAGRLRAVLDFGEVGVGDPACDLIPAWSLLTPETRAAFRTELALDDATWNRGRGWALSIAVQAIPYYRHTNQAFVGLAARMLEQIAADHHRHL
jgi:aminoglycoside phosphotransferase (APT) family kinase protein